MSVELSRPSTVDSAAERSSAAAAQRDPSHSRSPLRSLGARLQRMVSTDSRTSLHDASEDPSPDRSISRGRRAVPSAGPGAPGAPADVWRSSGRGGAGNIRSASRVDEGSFVESVPVRGREAPELPSSAHSAAGGGVSTGRGGAGNIRSPSRDTEADNAQEGQRQHVPGAPVLNKQARDEEVIRAAIEASRGRVRSSGRGGAGNIVMPAASA